MDGGFSSLISDLPGSCATNCAQENRRARSLRSPGRLKRPSSLSPGRTNPSFRLERAGWSSMAVPDSSPEAQVGGAGGGGWRGEARRREAAARLPPTRRHRGRRETRERGGRRSPAGTASRTWAAIRWFFSTKMGGEAAMGCSLPRSISV
uniref:Uncharacterized protein n=1 Tax=Oryza brachyantha TaxID=4533 RepID=J3L5K9_ORYBR